MKRYDFLVNGCINSLSAVEEESEYGEFVRYEEAQKRIGEMEIFMNKISFYVEHGLDDMSYREFYYVIKKELLKCQR